MERWTLQRQLQFYRALETLSTDHLIAATRYIAGQLKKERSQ